MKSSRLEQELLKRGKGEGKNLNLRDQGIGMESLVFVVDSDKTESQELCDVLERDEYSTIAMDSLENLEKRIEETSCRAVILDLDSLPVDNRFILHLRRRHPKLPIIGLSSSPFHPELEEALSSHVCACLRKPPDPDELLFCIKSFCQNESSNGKRPEREGT